jgi:hypothetical protein
MTYLLLFEWPAQIQILLCTLPPITWVTTLVTVSQEFFRGYLLPRQVHQIQYLLRAGVVTYQYLCSQFELQYFQIAIELRTLVFVAAVRTLRTLRIGICMASSEFEPTAWAIFPPSPPSPNPKRYTNTKNTLNHTPFPDRKSTGKVNNCSNLDTYCTKNNLKWLFSMEIISTIKKTAADLYFW